MLGTGYQVRTHIYTYLRTSTYAPKYAHTVRTVHTVPSLHTVHTVPHLTVDPIWGPMMLFRLTLALL